MSEVKAENRFRRYFKETRAEVRRVHWPTRKEARSLTTVVLAITVVMTAFLGAVSALTAVLAGSFFGDQNPVAIAAVAVVGVIGIIVLAIRLRRQ